MIRRVKVSDHAKNRFIERAGEKKNKKQLADLVAKCMYSQSRLGIDDIVNFDDSIHFRVRIASHNLLAVVCQDQADPLARWKVITFIKEG